MLLDGRGWEMVSPPDKHGALIEPIDDKSDMNGVVQPALDDSSTGYLAHLEGGAAGRRTQGGWRSRSPPLSVNRGAPRPSQSNLEAVTGRRYLHNDQ
jgi:hypothetical protein